MVLLVLLFVIILVVVVNVLVDIIVLLVIILIAQRPVSSVQILAKLHVVNHLIVNL